LKDLEFESEHNKFDTLDLIRTLNFGIKNGDGACHGIHRLSSLAICRQRLLHDLNRGGLSPSRKVEFRQLILEIEDNFLRVSKLLPSTQRSSGYWDENWANPSASGEAKDNLVETKERMAVRARATGHLLEWLNLVEPDFWPSGHAVERAVRYLEDNVAGNPEFYGYKISNVSSHVVTALINITPEEKKESN